MYMKQIFLWALGKNKVLLKPVSITAGVYVSKVMLYMFFLMLNPL